MKKRLVVLCGLLVFVCTVFMFGCSKNNSHQEQREFKAVEQVGNIPDEFKTLITKNSFRGITACGEKMLKSDIISKDEDERLVAYKIKMMDLFGKDLAIYTCSVDDAYQVMTLIATSDGGFLFVLGFEDYAYNQNEWASDGGFSSRVIKCDSKGKLEFDASFENVEGEALRYCFEANGLFYLFGTRQAPQTKKRGIYSSTDVYMAVIDSEGMLLKNQCISGSDYDYLDVVELSDDGFVLSISSQSDDNDFSNSCSNGFPVDWVIKVNDNLDITEKKKERGRDYFDLKLGEKDDKCIYSSDPLFDKFDAGSPTAFIDYSDFYMVVSENVTGIYEKTPPIISGTWYYFETVYSVYDYEGALIFRASVDSSPNYDKIVEQGLMK